MKFLKITGIVILLLVILIVVLNFAAPNNFEVERTIVADAPKEIVFDHVKYWRNWQAWSPWAEQDPTMKITIEGMDGEEGSVYAWTGDPEITGSGSMTNTGINEGEKIDYHLKFVEPWESEAYGYMKVTGVDQGTEIAWGFYGDMEFPFNIMLLFQSMEEMMQEDFTRGLTLLKDIVEKEAGIVEQFSVEQVTFPKRRYAAVRKTVPFSEMQPFYAGAYASIMETMKMKYARTTGAPAGIYYNWDQQNGTTDVAAAIPSNMSIKTDDISTITIEKSDAYLVKHTGDYGTLMHAHKALQIYGKQNGLIFTPPFVEEYVTDPVSEPDTSKWLTKIYYFTK